MGSFADALAQAQQFIAERQLADQQPPQQQAPQVSPLASLGTGAGGLTSLLPQMLQMQQQGGGMGGFSGPQSGHIVTEHGVSGNARAMSMLDRVAQQYPQLWSHIESSYRTRAEQARLYQEYLNGTGNLAAPPGHSEHEKGLAFDINAQWIDSRPGLRQLLDRLGGFPVGGEPWHWQPRWTM